MNGRCESCGRKRPVDANGFCKECRRSSVAQERCADCGRVGERTGHQDCQYPQNRETI